MKLTIHLLNNESIQVRIALDRGGMTIYLLFFSLKTNKILIIVDIGLVYKIDYYLTT